MVARLVFLIIAVLFAAIAGMAGSIEQRDETPLTASLNGSEAPPANGTGVAWSGAPMSFDDDEVPAFEANGTGVATAADPPPQEEAPPPAGAKSALGPACGFAKLDERPPRHPRG